MSNRTHSISQHINLIETSTRFEVVASSYDGHPTLRIDATDSIWNENTYLYSCQNSSFFMTREQLKDLSRTITDFLLAYDEPTINDIKRAIEESEGADL